MSVMAETMRGQPAELRRILADGDPPARAAERLAGRRLLLVGTGTSWHAANHGAWLLRMAGVEAWPVQAMDAALWGPAVEDDQALVLLSHRGTKQYTGDVLAAARTSGASTVVISAIGAPGAELETVAPERSSAFTASHLGAIARLAQIATALGAPLAQLQDVPDAVAAMLARAPIGVAPPRRLLEFAGAGPNQWTAAEGALKVRETSYLAAEGLSVEQFLHGPSVALRAGDTLVALDGGGPGSERLAEVVAMTAAFGSETVTIAAPELGEPLSVFALTTAVQMIALESAETLGTNPDSFGRDLPGREDAIGAVRL